MLQRVGPVLPSGLSWFDSHVKPPCLEIWTLDLVKSCLVCSARVPSNIEDGKFV